MSSCFRSGTFLFITIIIFFISGGLFAREIEIQVIDRDLDIPLEGAFVKTKNGERLTCDENGRIVITIDDDIETVFELSSVGYDSAVLTVTKTSGNQFEVGLHLSRASLQNEELVIEGKTAQNKTIITGRGLVLDNEKTKLSAEIGLVEDIMSSLKLLPGVGYTGLFNSQPSIRGGFPGDLTASLDGFYIDNPYHWGGAYSIFDPKMVESARLYHGVFSARYSHTISGLLEVNSRRAAKEYTDFEIGVSTSAASINVSYPLPDFSNFKSPNRGGIYFSGKVTYWDPFVWVAQGLAKSIEILKPVNAIRVAPYIRSFNLEADYSFTNNFNAMLNSYVGGDGVGVLYNNTTNGIEGLNVSNLKFDWNNFIGFLSASINYNPKQDMLLKTTIGASFNQSIMDADLSYFISAHNPIEENVTINNSIIETIKYRSLSVQGRIDYSYEIKSGILFSAGFEEKYNQWSESTQTNDQIDAVDPNNPGKLISIPYYYPLINNGAFFTSLWTIIEYKDKNGFFEFEAGLRGDHIAFNGEKLAIQSLPVINPRLNMDFNLVRNKGSINLFTLTFGTGLFSTMSSNMNNFYEDNIDKNSHLLPDKSFTSVAGFNIDFVNGFNFNLEFYYKYIFDRCYTTLNSVGGRYAERRFHFNGEGHIWGFDFILQKITGRKLSGWITFTFNYARYYDPDSSFAFSNARFSVGSDHWYFPEFHRFINLNLILNFKPLKSFNIYTRLGIASGSPKSVTGQATPYQSMSGGIEITKYRRSYDYSDTARYDFSLPMDVKFSWYLFNKNGKSQTEIYFAIENALSLIYTPAGQTTMNPYTGEEEEGGSTASYELPIPMVSFGFKWSY